MKIEISYNLKEVKATNEVEIGIIRNGKFNIQQIRKIEKAKIRVFNLLKKNLSEMVPELELKFLTEENKNV